MSLVASCEDIPEIYVCHWWHHGRTSGQNCYSAPKDVIPFMVACMNLHSGQNNRDVHKTLKSKSEMR